MQSVLDFASKLTALPLPQLAVLVALASLGVASFALYVVYAVITRGGGK